MLTGKVKRKKKSDKLWAVFRHHWRHDVDEGETIANAEGTEKTRNLEVKAKNASE
uniref:hypothetical protein n=1 Tax=Salmonella sp. TaxID=599 RepID=UPI001CD9B72D|nr:hypothetical protein [Salmonella sp.]